MKIYRILLFTWLVLLVSITLWGQTASQTNQPIQDPAAFIGPVQPARATNAVLRPPPKQTAPRPLTNDSLVFLANKGVQIGNFADLTHNLEPKLRIILTNAVKVQQRRYQGATEKFDLDPKLIEWAAFHQYARYFEETVLPKNGPLDTGQKETLSWLLQTKYLLPTLMLAVTDRDQPKQVLSVLTTLHRAFGPVLDQYPDMTTAFCVVRDEPSWNPQAISNPALFRHYLNLQNRFLFRPLQLPWQLAVYAVGVNVTPTEVEWASRIYGVQAATIGEAYNDVPYDETAWITGVRPVQRIGYTLPHLLEVGGICTDQAFFAIQVGRSLYIPIVGCLGREADTPNHEWVGYLQKTGAQARWNFDSGSLHQWSGTILDPQTGLELNAAEVMLLAELQWTAPSNRLLSLATMKCADLLDEADRVELLKVAIELSPANREAWLSLANQLSTGQVRRMKPPTLRKGLKPTAKTPTDNSDAWDRLAEIHSPGDLHYEPSLELMLTAKQFLVGKYPDFAFKICTVLLDSLKPENQPQAYQTMISWFGTRPDLVARCRLAQGSALVTLGRKTEALDLFQGVLKQNPDLGPVILEALQRTQDLLASQDQARLLGIYEELFTRLPKPTPSAFVTTSLWYNVGLRYAAFLQSTGQSAKSSQLRRLLNSYNTAPPRTKARSNPLPRSR